MAIIGSQGKKLSSRQHRAIAALLSEKDAKKAAEIAGIGYRTLCTWMEDRVFQTELKSAERELISSVVRDLITDMTRNHIVMREIRDGRVAPNVKLRAAIALDQALLKWREAIDIEERISNLEKAVFNDKR